jgi:hypothetical protein
MPGVAIAKKYRVNDHSGNNSCKFVHDWYLHVNVKHAVFVTTGGSAYGAKFRGGRVCQAGRAPTVAEAARAPSKQLLLIARKEKAVAIFVGAG